MGRPRINTPQSFMDKKVSRARIRRQNDPARFLWRGARQRAQREGLEFTLSLDDVEVPSHCPVLGIPLVVAEGVTPNSPSIDRRNNARGYTPDNIVVVSWRANCLKRDATPEELWRLAKFYGQES
ncbi:hypothetical protein STRZYGA_00550 [Brevundimonas phage vB_BpoS-Strzyga]|nr:hypothetical protein STRZYGA_00550 [Brevundimonas phage vB_BpoS-Strzyga]